MLIDIHAHLDHQYFDTDRDEMLHRAKDSGVNVILTAGIDSKTNRLALDLASKYDIVKPCLGIYPIQTLQKEAQAGESYKPESFDIDEEIAFIEKNKVQVSAIAEIGLDYYWEKEHISDQKKLFQKMLELAERLDKPIIVHSRKAESDCIDMISSSKLTKVIMHCFCGKKKLVNQIVDNGWSLTAPTSIVRSTQFQEHAQLAPITQLFCETDGPYLSPYLDKRNESGFISEAYKKLAEIKGMEYEEVVKNIWMNYQKMFS